MENLILYIAQNSDLLSTIMSVLTGLMIGLAIVSLMTTRKMYKSRKRAEALYIESLLKNKEFVEHIIKRDKEQHILEIYPKKNLVVVDGEDVFIHVFETLDENVQKQIEPALFQKNLNSRTAYLNKVVHEAKKTFDTKHSHC
ncbi:hypothetical protein [Acinetobacter sp. YH12100]|uniref:hypothetical protein n=1 Tax=Acinetobacter sp. YH12100 TaxID=2601089 RepID=UPI0015D18BA1|nr:hypothetical protein [Acinetobacter sp. YH12100]